MPVCLTIPNKREVNGVTWYTIEVDDSGKTWVVHKRYSDFHALDTQLALDGIPRAPLPSKGLIGLRKMLNVQSFHNQRLVGLQQYLRSLAAQIHTLFENQELEHFLQRPSTSHGVLANVSSAVAGRVLQRDSAFDEQDSGSFPALPELAYVHDLPHCAVVHAMNSQALHAYPDSLPSAPPPSPPPVSDEQAFVTSLAAHCGRQEHADGLSCTPPAAQVHVVSTNATASTLLVSACPPCRTPRNAPSSTIGSDLQGAAHSQVSPPTLLTSTSPPSRPPARKVGVSCTKMCSVTKGDCATIKPLVASLHGLPESNGVAVLDTNLESKDDPSLTAGSRTDERSIVTSQSTCKFYEVSKSQYLSDSTGPPARAPRTRQLVGTV